MTEPYLFSASQISTYRECARKWAWRYLEGVKPPPKDSARLGTEVDDEQIQPYLLTGRPFDYSKEPIGTLPASGYVATSMLPFLPKPKTVEIQHRFIIPSPTWIDGKHIGFGFQGYMDILATDSALLPGCAGGVPGIADTKTTTDISKWAKSEKELLTNVQAQLYAIACMFETGARVVDLDWIYGQTRGARKAKQVVVRVETRHVEEQFEAINETALEVFKIFNAAPKPLDLPPNPDACEMFGGCPYRDRCNLSPAQIRQGLAARFPPTKRFTVEGEQTMSTQDMLAALRAKKAAGQTPAAAVAVPAVPDLPAWATAKVDPMKAAHAAGKPYTAAPINPPESALPAPVEVEAPAAAEAPAKRHRRTKAEMEAARAAEMTSPPTDGGGVSVKFTVGSFEATITGLTGEALTAAIIATHATLTEIAEAL